MITLFVRHLKKWNTTVTVQYLVIDRNGCYVGTLTEGDLLWYIKDHKIVDLHMTEEIPPFAGGTQMVQRTGQYRL